MTEYVACVDLTLSPKVMPQVALSGYTQGQTQVRGDAVANTEVSQHVLNVLLLLKPAPNFVVRPKVALPMYGMSKGGSYPNFYVGLDVWLTVP